MNDVRDWLRAGDPVASEPPLSDADVQRIRQTIAAAGESQRTSFVDWARGSWAAATVVVALTIAVGMNRWFRSSPDVGNTRVDAAPTAAPREPGARRQVQLIAPGGTRIIWIFNDDFKP
jgi:hypothetical protein